MKLPSLLCLLSCYFLLLPSITFAIQTEAKLTPVLVPQPSIAEKNLALGKVFLEKNLKNPNIQSLPSGLQYQIVQEGTGTSPGPTDFVLVNYRGTLLDGTEFDSSYTHELPVTLAVNATIPGWAEALQLMKPGAKWKIYVPPHLAYGKEGVGKLIGPNMTLAFDIELISVKSSLDENQGNLRSDLED